MKYQFSMTSWKKTKIHDFPGWFQISEFSMTVGTLTYICILFIWVTLFLRLYDLSEVGVFLTFSPSVSQIQIGRAHDR